MEKPRTVITNETYIISIFIVVKLSLHFIVNLYGGYGYFRDELYYIACAGHLAFGYVDHPPLSIFILKLNLLILGDSIFALRFMPAISGALLIALTGLLVKELEGKSFALFLACTAVFVTPYFAAVNDFYSMNAFEILFWMSAAIVIIKIIKTGDQKLWILFGVISGLGVMNKHSMAFFIACIYAGIVLTGKWSVLKNRHFIFGNLIIVFISVPNLLWQISNGWPTLDFMRNAQQWKNVSMAPLEFLSAIFVLQHPFAFPVWFAGLVMLLFYKRFSNLRFLGAAFILLFIFVLTQSGKPYYISPFFPLLLAAGAVAAESFFHHPKLNFMAKAYTLALLLFGLVTLPLSIPILPVDTFIRYSAAIGIEHPRMESHENTALPQIYADRFGWEKMVSKVNEAYQSLSEDEKNSCVIYVQNYGEAGAIDFFGDKYGLPPASCGHNNYWLWGPQLTDPEVVIIVGGDVNDHKEFFGMVDLFGVHFSNYSMAYETNLPIYICRKPASTLDKVWDEVRKFI